MTVSPWIRKLLPQRESVDIASLVIVRIAFGLIMMWEVTRYFDHGWIADYWIEPHIHFTYLGFDWVKPWPGEGMYYHFLGLGIAAFLMVIGLAYRLAATALFLGFTYVFLLEQSKYLNHFYLVCLLSFLMIWIPAHRSFSLDARLGLANRTDFAPGWAVWILRFQLSVVYFYGGIAKLGSDWLEGYPMRLWLPNRDDWPIIGRFMDDEVTIGLFTYGGLAFDLIIVPLLLIRQTRLLAFFLVVVFHLINSLIWSIGIFPWMAIALTTIYFPPSWPRRFFRLPQHGDDPIALVPPKTGARELLSKCSRIGFSAYIAAQLLAPLRHWLYPGPVAWTEEGHHYSWRMKLRTRSGATFFFVTDNRTGWRREIEPALYLTEWQRDDMDSKPDMILQFVDYLEREFAKDGLTDITITAESQVSLNGRERQTFVDPELDLTTVHRSPFHKPWILPLTKPLPHHGEN